jgi:hypothetical protein
MVKLLVTPEKISIFGPSLAFQAKTQRHDLTLEPRIKILARFRSAKRIFGNFW